jgi:hypothetical protein
MHEVRIFTATVTLAVVLLAGVVFADDTPVIIKFDPKSARTDIVAEIQVPAYTKAERGSIQFYKYRLDTPDRFLNYMHDGVQAVRIEQLARIEKVQPQFDIWRLRYKAGRKNTPRIHHQSVSFIPINDDGSVGRRVYLMLDDLTLIDWGGGSDSTSRGDY